MSSIKAPADIARDAFKLLASRSLPPTPANFQACYNEIAGVPNVAGFPEAPLRQLSRALIARSIEQEKQLTALDGAIGHRDWKGVQEALVEFAMLAPAAGEHIHAPHPPTPGTPSAIPIPEPIPECLADIARLVENMLPALGKDDQRFSEQAQEFVQILRRPEANILDIHPLLAGLAHRASLAAEEQVEIRESLLKLLHLVLENIGELSIDDQWLRGQVDALLKAVQPPLTLRRLDDVERRVRDVMYKQTEARSRSVEAREEMRQMLTEFISRLSTMNESSSNFQGRMEESTRKIAEVKAIEDLAPLLKDVIGATRAMAEDTQNARSQLQSLQGKVEATEAELLHLHRELDSASAQARHDPLTDALNRKGLDEALEREVASMRRKDTPLSLSLLDVDNFKNINDQLGHETGDAALVHLVKVTRDCMRPADTLARWGGEEFVILMPDTTLEQGIHVMTRLQRELTKSFFLAGSDKILITFSAGVAQMGAGETGSEAIRRADQAMYVAKRAGKNRVLGG